MSLTTFRPLKNKRKLDVDRAGRILAQMQGLLDTEPDPENVDQMAFYGLVGQWYAMLQAAVVQQTKP